MPVTTIRQIRNESSSNVLFKNVERQSSNRDDVFIGINAVADYALDRCPWIPWASNLKIFQAGSFFLLQLEDRSYYIWQDKGPDGDRVRYSTKGWEEPSPQNQLPGFSQVRWDKAAINLVIDSSKNIKGEEYGPLNLPPCQDATDDPQDRVTMQGIDVIVAIPQYCINNNLAKLLAQGVQRESQRTGELEDFSLRSVAISNNQMGAQLNGNLDSVSVQVCVPNSPKKIIFTLTFVDGYLQYNASVNQVPQSQTIDLSGCQVSFEVDVDIQSVPTEKNVPPQIVEALNNLGNGVFSIQQLFMNFQTIDISHFSQENSIVPSDLDSAGMTYLSDLLNQYLNSDFQSAGGHVLGYSIVGENSGSLPSTLATFAPTKLDFITNQYQPPDLANETRNPEIDTLNYLMMTHDRIFPSNLAQSGNWIDPEDDEEGIHGIMSISKSLFMDRYLAVILAPLINYKVTLKDNSSSVDMLFSVGTEGIGHTPAGDSLLITNQGYSFETVKSSSLSSTQYTDTHYTVQNFTYLRACPGTNKIKIDLFTELWLDHTKWEGIKYHAISHNYRARLEIPQNLQIELGDVKDGMLTAIVTDVTPPPPSHVVYPSLVDRYTKESHGDVSIFDTGTVDRMDASISAFISTEAVHKKITQEIPQALSFSNQFVFPVGAQFNMKSVRFNRECDLLVDLEYKE
jgi:hypothetical protein